MILSMTTGWIYLKSFFFILSKDCKAYEKPKNKYCINFCVPVCFFLSWLISRKMRKLKLKACLSVWGEAWVFRFKLGWSTFVLLWGSGYLPRNNIVQDSTGNFDSRRGFEQTARHSRQCVMLAFIKYYATSREDFQKLHQEGRNKRFLNDKTDARKQQKKSIKIKLFQKGKREGKTIENNLPSKNR